MNSRSVDSICVLSKMFSLPPLRWMCGGLMVGGGGVRLVAPAAPLGTRSVSNTESDTALRSFIPTSETACAAVLVAVAVDELPPREPARAAPWLDAPVSGVTLPLPRCPDRRVGRCGEGSFSERVGFGVSGVERRFVVLPPLPLPRTLPNREVFRVVSDAGGPLEGCCGRGVPLPFRLVRGEAATAAVVVVVPPLRMAATASLLLRSTARRDDISVEEPPGLGRIVMFRLAVRRALVSTAPPDPR